MSPQPPRDTDNGAGEPRPGGDPAAEPCMACRGSGQVVSHLGGGSTMVTCPWCRGGGVRLTDVDAQQPWREKAQSTPAQDDEKPSPTDPPAGGEAA